MSCGEKEMYLSIWAIYSTVLILFDLKDCDQDTLISFRRYTVGQMPTSIASFHLQLNSGTPSPHPLPVRAPYLFSMVLFHPSPPNLHIYSVFNHYYM